MLYIPTRRLTLAAVVLTLSGCSLAPIYQRPESPVAKQWDEPVKNDVRAASAVSDWHGFVADPHLRVIVNAALINNRNLRKALFNIDAARAQYWIQRADRLPSLNTTASSTSQRLPEQLSPIGTGGVTRSHQVGLGLAVFEIDLFDGVRDLSAAALETYLATEQATRATQLSLVSEVIKAYLTQEGAQRQLGLVDQALQSRQVSLELVKQRRAASTAIALDYQEALGLTQARADKEQIGRQLRQARNALELLVGAGVAGPDLTLRSKRRVSLVQNIAPGTSSALIERRPDILASEHRLKRVMQTLVPREQRFSRGFL